MGKNPQKSERSLLTETTSPAQVPWCHHCWREGPQRVQKSHLLFPAEVDLGPAGGHKTLQWSKIQTEVLKELKGWINYDPALLPSSITEQQNFIQNFMNCPIFFLEPLRLGRKHSRGHLTSTKLLRILTLNDELLLQASPNIYFLKAIKKGLFKTVYRIKIQLLLL